MQSLKLHMFSHCHDWQTGLIPVYLNERFQGNPFYHGMKTVVTIHNLKFQGVWNAETIQMITGLPGHYFSQDKLGNNNDGNYLKGGLVFADAITTVSIFRSSSEILPSSFAASSRLYTSSNG